MAAAAKAAKSLFTELIGLEVVLVDSVERAWWLSVYFVPFYIFPSKSALFFVTKKWFDTRFIFAKMQYFDELSDQDELEWKIFMPLSGFVVKSTTNSMCNTN